jgi:hypothetical protein
MARGWCAGPIGRATALTLNAAPASAVAGAGTEHIKPAHVIRKVVLRQIAILNYVNPF